MDRESLIRVLTLIISVITFTFLFIILKPNNISVDKLNFMWGMGVWFIILIELSGGRR